MDEHGCHSEDHFLAEFALLHARVDDNDKQIEENGRLIGELMQVRIDTLKCQNELSRNVNELSQAVKTLTEQTATTRAFEGDLLGTIRFMERLGKLVGVLWKPLLFAAVLGASIYTWVTGKGKFP